MVRKSREEYERYKAEQAEGWLANCRRLVDLERSMRALAADQREMADGIGAIDYSRISGTGAPKTDAIPENVARCMEAATSFDALVQDICRRRAEAAAALSRMDNPIEAAALTRYYLLGETWERVCVALGYSMPGMMDLRKRALASAYGVMPHSERDPRHQAI